MGTTKTVLVIIRKQGVSSQPIRVGVPPRAAWELVRCTATLRCKHPRTGCYLVPLVPVQRRIAHRLRYQLAGPTARGATCNGPPVPVSGLWWTLHCCGLYSVGPASPSMLLRLRSIHIRVIYLCAFAHVTAAYISAVKRSLPQRSITIWRRKRT